MRVYIHIADFDGWVEDKTGVEVSSADAARKEAIEDLRYLAGERIKNGQPVADLRVSVLDESGQVLDVLPWQAAIVAPPPRQRQAEHKMPKKLVDNPS
jgi:hypothetical protein